MLLAGPHFSIQPVQKRWTPHDILLCFRKDEVLLYRDEMSRFSLPTFDTACAYLPADCIPEELFSLNDRYIYYLDIPADEKGTNASHGTFSPSHDAPVSFQPSSVFRTLPSREDAFALVTAFHLLTWLRNNRFCGRCGSPYTSSETERALHCAACGQTIYPTIAPAVSVAITDGDRLLLARNARASFRHYSLIAGYVETGESMEETVAREVMEEVGLRVKNIRYVASQAWGWSQALMIGFHAELDGSDKITLQESELTEARWFHRNEIEADSNPLSLSFDLIEKFRTNTLP